MPKAAKKKATEATKTKTKTMPSSAASRTPRAKRGRSGSADRPARAGRDERGPVDRAPPRGKYDRSQPAAERSREQRRRLFAAATKVFATKGYAKSTVDDVCALAGVSRRTFYEHFVDLRDVLVKLHDRLGNLAFRTVEAHVRAQTHIHDQTRAGVEGLLGLIAAFPDESKVVFRELRAGGPDLEARREALLARFTTLVVEGVARGHAVGLYSVPPDEVRVYGLIAAIEAVGMRYLERREHTRALEAAPALIDMMIRTFA